MVTGFWARGGFAVNRRYVISCVKVFVATPETLVHLRGGPSGTEVGGTSFGIGSIFGSGVTNDDS